MEREYELFERFPDGETKWRGTAHGLEDARRKLLKFARHTTNEIFAMHLSSQQVVARVNDAQKQTKRVFQIAYDSGLLVKRAKVLRSQGYSVTSVIGNEAAKTVLGLKQEYDLFVVGHGAPDSARMEMVAWLKAQYPKAKIVALNSADTTRLPGADYNARQNGPETWLPLVIAALSQRQA
jgi:hypothetical protein